MRYHVRNNKPGIKASFRPFRDFLQDLELANGILIDDCENIRDEYPNRDDAVDGLQEFIEEKDKYIEAVGEEAYQSLLLSHRMIAQEELLSGFNIGLRDLYDF